MTGSRLPSAIALVLVATLVAQAFRAPTCTPAASQDGISVYFSPHGGCTNAIVEQIDKAQRTIMVQAYSFTSAPMAKALMEAHKRGVAVTAILDSSQRTDKYSSATFFFNQGIATFIDPNHAIAHNKVILIDGRTIITGSFNFSKAAEESNAENLLIIEGKADLFAAYQRNCEEHLAHAVPYEGRTEAPPPAIVSTPGQGTDEASITVHITRSGKKYHRAGCRSLSRSDTPISLKDAKARGYTPCSICDPP